MTISLAVDVHRIAKLYGRSAALKSITLRLEAGETVALLGPNGSGKTTLLKILAGAIVPTLGTGSIFGLDLIKDRVMLRTQISLLASETYLYDDLTACENLRFVLTVAGRKCSSTDIRRALNAVDLAQHADGRVRTFSSGMKRRVALARTMLLEPRLLLLDEPYNSLDEAGSDLVDEYVRQVKDRGGASILATHDAQRGLSAADRVARLDRGVLTFDGPVHGYLSGHETQHAHRVG